MTGTPWPGNRFRSFFLEGTQRGVFTEWIYNDVSRGHSVLMQTIQVTIRGQSGGMLAAVNFSEIDNPGRRANAARE